MANRQAGRVQGGDATVIGAGIVGVCCALCLQHDGWRVTLLDPEPPGEACSFGNSGMLARGAIPPIAMPGVLWRVPGMLLNPLGPLAIRWSYLPRAAPWLLRFVRSSSKARVERITAELASLYRLVPDAYRPLVEAAGAEALYRSGGVLQLYESKEAFAAARWDFDLRRRHGAEMEMLGPEEIRQFEPALAPVFGLEVVTAPTAGRSRDGLTQFRVSAEGFDAHLLMSHVAAQTQALRYLSSFLDDDPENDGDIAYDCGGSCDLVDAEGG